MTHYSTLTQALRPHLSWHGARIAFLGLFLIALFKVKTVNLQELSVGFQTRAKPESSYKRLQRFFREFPLSPSDIAVLVVRWMQIPAPWVLSLDRTTWEFGDQCHNFIVLGIVHEGMCYPILWRLLPKKGNTNQGERIDLLNEFHRLFPQAQVDYLCGDREFIGQAWIYYLQMAPALSFRLRIRASDRITRQGICQSARVTFAHLQVGDSQSLWGDCRVWGHRVTVSALRLPSRELLVVIAPVDTPHPIQDYGQRWGIETLFGVFKTRGFCLESTHLKDPQRISTLFGLLTLALCWAMYTGQFLAHHNPIPIKNHGRKSKSVFRLGFDYIRHILLNPHLSTGDAFSRTFSFLSCT